MPTSGLPLSFSMSNSRANGSPDFLNWFPNLLGLLNSTHSLGMFDIHRLITKIRTLILLENKCSLHAPQTVFKLEMETKRLAFK